jgi:cullin-4
MIAKLKAECGATFTNKLEGMFKDMDLSRELMANYAQWREANVSGRCSLDMVVQVLTTGFWPGYPIFDVQVPPQLTEHIDR